MSLNTDLRLQFCRPDLKSISNTPAALNIADTAHDSELNGAIGRMSLIVSSYREALHLVNMLNSLLLQTQGM